MFWFVVQAKVKNPVLPMVAPTKAIKVVPASKSLAEELINPSSVMNSSAELT